MLPAHKRFHADEMKTTDIDLRLILNCKLRSFEAWTQIAFEYELFESARSSASGVELIDVPAKILCPVERGAGILQETSSVSAIVRIETDADATGYEDL